MKLKFFDPFAMISRISALRVKINPIKDKVTKEDDWHEQRKMEVNLNLMVSQA